MQLSLISLALTKVYGGVAAFSPSSLFASGEQGVWYDPSDLTTMFQDSAGTTPVTADGQPVGLILDKSNGLALQELVVNRSFDSGASWTLVGGAISGGNLTFSASAANDYASNASAATVAGDILEFTITITAMSAGSIRPQCGGTVGTTRTSAGTYTERVRSVGAGVAAIVATAAGTTATISEFSVKRISGNHASQATAASRPLYKTDGTYHWLQFDGVDDALATASINWGTADKSFAVSGYALNIASPRGRIFAASGTGPGSFNNFFNISTAKCTCRGNVGAFTTSAAAIPVPASGVKNVLTQLTDLASATAQGSIDARNNGVHVAYGDAIPGGGTFETNTLDLGFDSGNVWYLACNIYSLIVLGRLATTQEITDTETWVAAKTGVTL